MGAAGGFDEARIQQLMSDPNLQQSMNEALNNPDFVNMLVDSNPMLRNVPNAREIINSPFMREMMRNPQMVSQAMRMQRNMQGGDAAFPAPGATDTTPQGAAAAGTGNAEGNNGQGQQNPFANPFMPGGQQGGGLPDMNQILQQMQALNSMGLGPFSSANQGQNAGQTASAQAGTETQGAGQNQSSGEQTQTSGTTGQTAGQPNTTSPPPMNPFASLFAPPGGQNNNNAFNPFGLNPDQMRQMQDMMQMFPGGAGAGGAPAAPSPPDNRPPEERYAEQLRQLNDMGFFDFDRNVAALRRSGGSVQGAIEHLLS